jgi:cysteine-rich repeat protein
MSRALSLFASLAALSATACSFLVPELQEACGDGVINAGEQCDDTNTANGDGCNELCLLEIPICGDGAINAGEQCDDANTADNDGCDSLCAVEPDFVCTGAPSLCISQNTCGNGTIDIDEVCYAQPLELLRDGGPRNVAIGELNQNNLPDTVVVLSLNDLDNVEIFFDGDFSSPVLLSAGAKPESLVLANLDENNNNPAADGFTDFAVANEADDSVTLFLQQTAPGTFVSQTISLRTATSAATLGPQGITAADLLQSGEISLITANQLSDTLSLLPGNGDGTFAAPIERFAGNTPRVVVSGDLNPNEDDAPDLVFALRDADIARAVFNVSDALDPFPGNGPRLNLSNGVNGPETAAIADFDQDGNPDIVVVNGAADDARVFFGNGFGEFPNSLRSFVGPKPFGLVPVDFNDDGAIDLAITQTSPVNRFNLFRNDGNGFFSAVFSAPVAEDVKTCAAGDLNNDGAPDFVTVSESGNTVSVFFSNP